MSEVLTRSLITGLSSVFLVTVLFIFGGATLRDFAFAMMIGLLSGTYSSIFIASPVLTHWKEREPAYRRRRERIEEQLGRVPAFPEDNVVARVDGGEEPVHAETPVAAAPAPSRADAPPPSRREEARAPSERPAPSEAPARPEPSEPPSPVGAPRDGGSDGGDGQRDGGNGAAEDGGDGAESPQRERPELSEASAAALRRVREQQGGGRKKRRKHGRNR
jgi:SecD/SecF fusion protein